MQVPDERRDIFPAESKWSNDAQMTTYTSGRSGDARWNGLDPLKDLDGFPHEAVPFVSERDASRCARSKTYSDSLFDALKTYCDRGRRQV